MIERLLTSIRSAKAGGVWPLLGFAVLWLGAACLICLFIQLMLSIHQITFWRHDALIYLDNYDIKLATEGRWVNYFAFSFLKALPPHLSWYVFYFGWLILFFMIMSDIAKSRSLGALCALAITLSGGLSAQAFWPSTMLLVPYILVALYALVRKQFRLSAYTVGATLLLGSLSSAVFLFPLFWWRQIKDWQIFKTIGLLIFWVGLFGLGSVIAMGLVYLLTGEPLHPAKWRFYNRPEDLSDILPNLLHSWRGFVQHIHMAFPGKGLWLISAAIICVGLLFSPNRDELHLKERLLGFGKMMFWVICAVIACHLQGGLLGMHVSFRTSWIMLPSIITLIAFAYRGVEPTSGFSAVLAIAVSALLIWVGYNGAQQSLTTTAQFKEVSTIVSDVKAQIEIDSDLEFSKAKAIVFYAPPGAGAWKIQKFAKIKLSGSGPAEGLTGADYRWVRAFRTRPSQKEVLCISDQNSPPHCRNRFLPAQSRLDNWECGRLHHGVCTEAVWFNGNIVVRIPTIAEARAIKNDGF